MKNLYIISLLFCVFLCKPASADVVGSEITYACTSTTGIFEVTLVLYIECNGLPLCPGSCGTACTQSLSVKGADPGYTNSNFGSITLSLVNVRDMDQIPNCPSAKSTCTNRGCTTAGTFAPGYERYEFKGFANIGSSSGIPAACCNVRFAYEGMLRFTFIQTFTINNQAFYVDAIVNRCHSISPCNSSPQYTNDPIGVVCPGEQFLYNGGVIDPDRDSLSFAFAPALQDFGIPVTYTSPFSYDYPMPWTGSTAAFPPAIWCHSETGDIRFTPGNASGLNFTGNITTEVKQWKKIGGVPTVIGVTRRDIQMTIMGNCAPNNPPRLTTNPPEGNNPQAPKTDWNICEGQQLCFTITSKDTDFLPTVVSDTTFLQWDGNLSALGATFTPTYEENIRHLTGPREATYQFCWTPPIGSASTTPYMMTVKTNDTKCPIPGRSSRTFRFRVRKLPTLTIVKNDLGCGKFTIGYSISTPGSFLPNTKLQIAKAPFDYTFASGSDSFMNMSSSPELSFTAPGKYLIQLTQTSQTCTEILYDTLFVEDFMSNLLSHQSSIQAPSCIGTQNGEIRIQGIGGIPPYTYRMGTTGNYTSDSVFENLAPNTYTISIRDQRLCVTTFTLNITDPMPVSGTATVSPAVCSGTNSGSILATGTGGTKPYTYRLEPSENYTTDSLFSKLAAGTYTIQIMDKNGCTGSFTKVVDAPEPLISSAQTKPVSCFGAIDGTTMIHCTGGTKPYQYKLGIGGIVSADSTFNNLSAGNYTFYTIDHAGCTDSVTISLHQPIQTIAMVNQTNPSCFGKSDGQITIHATQGRAPFQYSINSGVFGNNNSFNNLTGGTYSVTVKDSNGCLLDLSTTLTPPPPITAGTISGNTTVVQNAEETYSTTPNAGLNYVWGIQKGSIISGQYSSSIQVHWDSAGTGHLDVIVYSEPTCGDTATLTVNIGVNGLDESARLFGLEVFPNPTSGLLHISLKKLPADRTLKLYDMQGKTVMEQELKETMQLNLETLPQGVYMLRIGEWRGQIIKR